MVVRRPALESNKHVFEVHIYCSPTIYDLFESPFLIFNLRIIIVPSSW